MIKYNKVSYQEREWKRKTVVKVIYKGSVSELFIKVWYKDTGSISKVTRLSGQNGCIVYIPRNNYSKIPHKNGQVTRK